MAVDQENNYDAEVQGGPDDVTIKGGYDFDMEGVAEMEALDRQATGSG